MAPTRRLMVDAAALPRLLYVGDVAVADTMAGEALLYRLLQFYPADKLAIICAVRPGMPMLEGVQYHDWAPAFPRLLQSRVAEEYVLWRAWRYYEVPPRISHIATMFKPQAILSISHVSAWLAASRLAPARRIPLHLIAHDDRVYADRFPSWSRAWAERKFAEAYRAAAGRFCISRTMAEVYEQRFGAPGEVILPTHKGGVAARLSARATGSGRGLVFGYGGSINSSQEMDQIIGFARCLQARSHRLIAYTPQHQLLFDRSGAAGVTIETHAPVHSDALMEAFRRDVDVLLLPQSMAEQDLPLVSTAFPTKWADYSTVGLPVVVFAPEASSSARFVHDHPGCAALVTSSDPVAIDGVLSQIAGSADYRRSLAATLLEIGQDAFAPEGAWRRFAAALIDAPAAAI